ADNDVGSDIAQAPQRRKIHSHTEHAGRERATRRGYGKTGSFIRQRYRRQAHQSATEAPDQRPRKDALRNLPEIDQYRDKRVERSLYGEGGRHAAISSNDEPLRQLARCYAERR